MKLFIIIKIQKLKKKKQTQNTKIKPTQIFNIL